MMIYGIVCAGVVSTLAGSGTGLGFNYPYGVSVDSNGAVYVADYGNHRIRKVSSSGGSLGSLRISLASSVSVGYSLLKGYEGREVCVC